MTIVDGNANDMDRQASITLLGACARAHTHTHTRSHYSVPQSAAALPPTNLVTTSLLTYYL